MQKIMLICIAGALLVGCDYTVPLVKTPTVAIDAAVVGLWQRTDADGKGEQLLVLPLSKAEFLVVFPVGAKEAMFARGCLWRSAALTLVQLDWLGTAQAKLPTDNRTFQFVSYVFAGDTLKCRFVNPDVVSKDIESADMLAKTIAANQDNAQLGRNEIVFQKVKE